MIPENYLICLQLENKQLFFGEKPELTIGRKSDRSQLVFSEDPYISGLHAVIVLRGSDWYLIDRHSANGTFLNEQKLNPDEEYPLQVGDRIRLANTTLVVRALRTYEDVPGYLTAGATEAPRPAREPEAPQPAPRPVPPAPAPMPPAPAMAGNKPLLEKGTPRAQDHTGAYVPDGPGTQVS